MEHQVNKPKDQGISAGSAKGGHGFEMEKKSAFTTQVERNLKPGSLGLPLWHYKTIESTNLEGRRRAEAGAPHGACLVADYQSAGRGRLERSWQAPPCAGLLFSVILRPKLACNMVFGLTNLMALAICKTIERSCGLHPGIKWPNDVYLGNKKLVGILTEFTPLGNNVKFAVVGAGLNVNTSKEDLHRLPAPAESLKSATGRFWDRAELLSSILTDLDRLYARFTEPNPHILVHEYNQRSTTVGQRISVRDGKIVRTGRAQRVDEDGALVMLENSGKLAIIRHGDVSVLKNK